MSRYNIVMPTVGTPTTVTFPSTGGTLALLSQAGVVGFSGSQNTAAPNNTINASRMLVDAATTNADIVLQPKGTGAMLASLPDGLAAGGNKRGQNALDLQTSRNAAAQVASGNWAVIVGGQNNTANSAYSIVVGGFQNSAANQNAQIFGGQNNNAQGFYATIVGGEAAFVNSASQYSGVYSGSGQSISSANYAIAIGGTNNTISTGSDRSAIVGGANNSIPFYAQKSIILAGENAMAYQSNTAYLGTGGTFATAGASQIMWTVLGAYTSSSQKMLRDNQNNQSGFAIRQSTAVFLDLTLVSVSSNGAKTCVQTFQAGFKRDNANAISLLYFSSPTVLQNSFTGAPTLTYAMGQINASNPEHYGVDFTVNNVEAVTTRHTLSVQATIASFS